MALKVDADLLVFAMCRYLCRNSNNICGYCLAKGRSLPFAWLEIDCFLSLNIIPWYSFMDYSVCRIKINILTDFLLRLELRKFF